VAIARPALALLASLTTGCFLMPTDGPRGGASSGAGGVGTFGKKSAGRCMVHPHLFESWTDPVELPPSCTSEGWVRQVVRDIHEVDPCLDAPHVGEARFALGIDARGALTRVQLIEPSSETTRACIERSVGGWEFAPAAEAGELLVVYRPRG
jgi:hypothetical protein